MDIGVAGAGSYMRAAESPRVSHEKGTKAARPWGKEQQQQLRFASCCLLATARLHLQRPASKTLPRTNLVCGDGGGQRPSGGERGWDSGAPLVPQPGALPSLEREEPQAGSVDALPAVGGTSLTSMHLAFG